MLFNLGLFFFTLLTRFIKLDWGNGFFFHPDENNMARSISSMSVDLNPHFFAYGQFPLYLVYFTLKFLKISLTFENSVYLLRFFSALFSCIAIYVFYRLSRFVLSKNNAKIFALLLIFSPGLIQLAKFGTTESLLILTFALSIYISLLFYQTKKNIYILFSAMVSAIAIATKISSLVFLSCFILTIFFSFPIKKSFILTFLYLIITFSLVPIFSPYNIIKFSDFRSASIYETSVATGKLDVFYTRQFKQAPAYIFQLFKVLPFALGLPVFILAFVSLIAFKPKKNQKIHLLIIFLPCLLYFSYFGYIYVKWFRFLSPVFFTPILLVAIYLSHLHSSLLKYCLVILAIIPGIMFLSVYLHPDIRLTASNWINSHLDSQSVILSEAGNVVDIPLFSSHQTINFNFYNLDQDPQLQAQLPQHISQADYIIIPSRRIFKNQNNPSFPYSQKYYQSLFNGQLGFSPLKTFSPLPEFLNHENAEETFTVFDHPTIRIYQKTSYYDLSYYDQILKP